MTELSKVEVRELPYPKIFEEHEDYIFWIGYQKILYAAPAMPLTHKYIADDVVLPLRATGLSAGRRQFFKSIRDRLIKQCYPA